MKALNLKLVRGTLGALVVGALGFGAAQALASPVQAAYYGCTEWDAQACTDSCVAAYGPYARGRCTNFGIYDCQCFFGPIDA
jgi:hypothetical protein